jgi:hypothetical protein
VSRRGRILKFLALAIVGGIALATFVANYQREALAREIINRLLRDAGIVATSLSIESMGTDHLALGRLVLEQEDGTEYDLRGLSMPLSFPSMRPELIRIDSIDVTPGRNEPQPVRPASLLRNFLALPSIAPNTAVATARITWPGSPPMESVVWHAAEQEQRLDLIVLGLATSVGVSGTAPGVHSIVASARPESGVELFRLTVEVTESDQAYGVEGTLSLDLGPLLSVNQVLEYAGNVDGGSGTLAGKLQARLDDDAQDAVVATLALRIPDAANFRYAPPDSARVDATVLGEQELELGAHYPALRWNISSGRLAARLDIDGSGDLSVELNDLACVEATRCEADVSLDARQLVLGTATIRDLHAEAGAGIDRSAGDVLRLTGLQATTGIASGNDWSVGTMAFRSDTAVELQLLPAGPRADLPTAMISMAGLRSGDVSVATLQAKAALEFMAGNPGRVHVTGLTGSASDIDSTAWTIGAVALTDPTDGAFELRSTDWQGTIERVALRADVVRIGESLNVSMPVTLTGLRITDSGLTVAADFSIAPRAAELRWDDLELVTPAFDGRFVAGATYTAELNVSNPARSTAGRIVLRHDPADGEGHLEFRDGALDFETTPLSRRVQRWQMPWDLVRGEVAAAATLDWRELDGETVFDGRIQVDAENVAGNYGDIAFAGLAGSMALTVDPAEGLRGEQAAMTVSLFDVGVPLEDVSASVQWDASGDALAITDLSMSLLGGRLTAEPFRYLVTPGDANARLAVESVQLPLIVALAEFESVDMTGSLSGTLPVSIAGKTVTISGGRLASDPPGGVIRYLGGVADPSATSGLGLVSKALSNFRYESLTSDVDYTDEGDLKLQMRLTGVNPDMDDRQPVILNLGVENNIPQLLRSLQATRAIEDVLEKRGRNQ